MLILKLPTCCLWSQNGPHISSSPELCQCSGFTSYPCVPGHELAGVVTWVGRKVTKVKVGDNVGVGCMVDSCGDCKFCQDGEEQFCPTMVSTYAGDPQHGNCLTESGHTHGGYSAQHTVPER